MSFSRQILVGLAAGIAVGVFFGEYAAAARPLADGFVKLLQMTVLPYVVVSIVTSLGSLTPQEAKRLGLRAGAVVIGLWAVALSFAFLFPLAFPSQETASFFSSSLIEKRPPFDFVSLFIPANPFHSLANNIVPAVVLFSIIFGVALIGVERRAALLDVLAVAGQTVSRATRFIVRLTPYGLFAIAASAAGTLDLAQLGRIQIYLLTYTAIALLVALWVLPGLVVALTPFSYREVLGPSRNALITAFMAGDLFIVLPALTEACKDLIKQHGLGEEAGSLPDVIVPASFNVPHTGKLLSISFILFAGWFADAAVSLAEYPRLAITGLLTFFGSLNVAIPFLLDLFRIPADTFQLFLATGVINSRVGTLVAAVHTIAVGLLGSAALVGAVRFRPARVGRFAIVTLALVAVTIGGLRVLFETALRHEFSGADVVYGMRTVWTHPDAPVVQAPATETTSDSSGAVPRKPVLEDLRARGRLRVGVFAGRLPFVFRNRDGRLTGFDAEMAHLMARDLHVSLEFVEIPSLEVLPALLASGHLDIVMSGVPVTPLRAAYVLFSEPYLDETLGFVVRDHLRDGFASWSQIRQLGDVKVSIPNIPYYIDMLRQRVPGLQLDVVDIAAIERGMKEERIEALVLPAERGSVLTLLHPKYTVVVPEGGLVRMPLGYALARRDQDWAHFVNTWIELKRRDGSIDTLYRHWVLGEDAVERKPRWSVLRNVLGWVE